MNETQNAAAPAPLSQSAVVMLTQAELGALTVVAMCADPKPPNLDQVALNAFLDRASQQMGASDWIDAYHRIPITAG